MKLFAALALGTALSPSIVVKNKAEALFFVAQDCPVSNYYSHEIHRICGDYKSHGLDCELVYVDPNMTAEDVRKHAGKYGHGDYPKVVGEVLAGKPVAEPETKPVGCYIPGLKFFRK